jgi:hypothetical protein
MQLHKEGQCFCDVKHGCLMSVETTATTHTHAPHRTRTLARTHDTHTHTHTQCKHRATHVQLTDIICTRGSVRRNNNTLSLTTSHRTQLTDTAHPWFRTSHTHTNTHKVPHNTQTRSHAKHTRTHAQLTDIMAQRFRTSLRRWCPTRLHFQVCRCWGLRGLGGTHEARHGSL